MNFLRKLLFFATLDEGDIRRPWYFRDGYRLLWTEKCVVGGREWKLGASVYSSGNRCNVIVIRERLGNVGHASIAGVNAEEHYRCFFDLS